MTPADLYAIGMESNTAGDLMRELCKALGVAYPPKPDDNTEITGKTTLQNFIQEVTA